MSIALKKDKREPVRIQLRKNDQVKVIAGRDRGKTGRILGVNAAKGRILVEHVNMVKRHTRKNPAKQIAGRHRREGSARSRCRTCMILCSKCGPVWNRAPYHGSERETPPDPYLPQMRSDPGQKVIWQRD